MQILLAFLLFLPFELHAMNEVMRLMSLTCDKKKEPVACYNLANLYLDKQDKENSEKYFNMACKLDYEKACQRVRWEKRELKKKQKVSINAKKFFDKECAPLFGKFSECIPFKCSQEHFIVSEFIVHYQVHQTDLNGICKFTHTMPAGQELICLLDKLARKRFRDRTDVESFLLLEDYEKVGLCNVRKVKD